MGRSRVNKFQSAIRHLKSNQIDEKFKSLSEAAPTNSISGLYIVEPEKIVQDSLGLTRELDFTQDDSGTDTTGLFDDNGVILTIEPPGDTSYVLGPMSSMWYAWGNFTQIGYIRESDRRMVNLGRITGELSAWDGSSNFTSYGQLTLEQAVWFRDTPKQENYRAFYPGPPSSTPDQYGRYYCTITGTPKSPPQRRVPPVRGGPEDVGYPWGMFKNMVDSIKKFGQDILSNLTPGSLAQLGVRMLRSITDPILFAGDYIFKGLPSGIDYIPNFTGAGPFGLPKIADMPGAVARWFTGGQANPVSNVIDNTVQAVLGKNYATQYFTPDLDTAIKYAGDGGTVVAIPRTQGIQGWKNWLGSNVSRGFDPSKGVEQLVSTADAVAADVAGLTQKGLVNNADDIARLQQLASQGAKANTALGKLGQAIPFAGAVVAAADVNIRLLNGDYAGALLGGISAIPGPVGWVGLGAQIIADVAGVTDPNSPSNQLLKSVIDTRGSAPPNSRVGVEADRITTTVKAGGDPNFRIRDAGGSGSLNNYQMVPGVLEGYNLLTEEQLMKDINNLRAALFELGLPKDRNQYARQQSALLLSMGINPGMVMLIAKAIQQEPFTPEEEKYLKKNLPTLISMFGNIREQMESVPTKSVKESKEVLTESRKRIVRDVKKPYKLPETPNQKYTIKPKVIGSNRVINSDLMRKAEVPSSFVKPEERLWGKYEKKKNTRNSQEKKNELLDHLGASEHAWEWLTETSKNKNNEIMYGNFGGKNKQSKPKVVRREEVKGDAILFIADENGRKDHILQSELSIKIANEFEKELFDAYFQEQETMQYDNDPLFKKVAGRLKKEIDYPDKPSKAGYPDTPPPEMVNGFHPEYGQKADRYNKLDPQSAEAMPPTGNPEIDAKVQKAKRLKKILGKRG